MKKTFLFITAVVALALSGCKEDRKTVDLQAASQRDSLQKIITQKDNEINDMMETFNQIQAGFREINEAENRVTVMKEGEGTDKTRQIMENIQTISTTMRQNRVLIEKLRQQLRESSFKSEQLKATIEELVSQMNEKDKQLRELQDELKAKDIHIAQLDETISELNDDVTTLKTDNTKKAETISSQDKMLNTAWFVFGTKKELKDQRIIDGDKVLEANFNKSYFTKIDIRVEKEIKLYSKSARILTMHPSESYSLQRNANKQYVLRIINPQIFWSTSKYLVVLVK
ncbi:MAG: hypothetical protein ACI350_02750 [Prevotella sp.]